MTLCNLEFFLCQIAAYIDHLHTVLQGRLDGLDIVGSGDEHDIRQIIIYVEIIVMERRILLRIKRFQKCRRWIALDVLCEFVHFIEHNHRVGCTRTVDAIEDTSRQRAHVCLPMTTDF